MRLDVYHHLAGKQALDDLLVEVEMQRTKLDRFQALGEHLMANLTALQAAVATAIAYINTLKATQADPAEQGAVDQLTAELTAATTAPAPPA